MWGPSLLAMAWNLDVPDAEYYTLSDPALDGIVREVYDQKKVALDTETDGLDLMRCKPFYWSLSWMSSNGRDRRLTMPAETMQAFKYSFADLNKNWIFANAKFDVHMCANRGINIAGRLVDVSVMHALLYDEEPHGLKEMALRMLGWKWTNFEDTFGRVRKGVCRCGATQAAHENKTGYCKKTGCGMFRQISPLDVLHKAEQENMGKLIDYAANDAYGTWKLEQLLAKEMSETPVQSFYDDQWPYIRTMKDYYDQTEVPFTRVLYACERNGLRVDRPYLEKITPSIISDMEALRFEINSLTGRLMKTSGPGLAKYFCEENGIRPHKMTKGGKSGIKKPSVDAKFLQWIADDRPGTTVGKVAKLLVEHEAISKQYSTYIQKMPARLDSEDRVHMKLNQDVARTGRLSCVAAWTPIETVSGVKPAEEVRVGDLVWTHNGRWRSVLRAFTKGWEDMYDVILCNGEVLTCTNAHKLLLDNGQWVTLKEIQDEHIQRVGGCRGEPVGSASNVPLEASPYDAGDSRQATDHYAQRGARTEALHVYHGEESTGEGAVLGVKDGQQEPHAGQERSAAPSLEGGVRRRAWVFDLPVQGQAAVRAPCRTAGGAGITEPTSEHGGAPHRQQPQEQLPRQPGIGHKERAPGYPLLAGQGLRPVEIKEVVYRGRFEVYDFTIAEDASYAACGVFSHNSSDPNMQNVTTGEKDRFHLRNAFIAAPGYSMVVADYSQLEMRILAAASQEPAMMAIFHKNWDIHMGNASLVFDLPYDDIVLAKKVDKQVKEGKLPPTEMTKYVLQCLKARGDAKTIGFGLNYGMKEKAMAARMGCSVEEAEVKIEQYMAKYPAVQMFFDEAGELAREHGAAYTFMGRRRRLPNINAKKDYIRFRAERQASNMPIQGTAAEACKMAMIHLYQDVELREKYGYRMCLQVHDEIVGECPIDSVTEVKNRIHEWMEHPFPTDIGVPLLADVGSGPSWGSAK